MMGFRRWLSASLKSLADRVRPEPTDFVIGMPQAPTPSDLVWAKASADYITSHADKLRERAGGWAASATGILALVGLSTAFKGRETLDAVAPSEGSILAVLVIVAIVTSGAALFAAALAGQGIPGEIWSDPDSFRLAQLRGARRTSMWLAASRALVALAFAVSVVGLILLWTAPKPEPTRSDTLVIGRDAAFECGELAVANGQLTIGGEPPPAPPLGFYSVPECPER